MKNKRLRKCGIAIISIIITLSMFSTTAYAWEGWFDVGSADAFFVEEPTINCWGGSISVSGFATGDDGRTYLVCDVSDGAFIGGTASNNQFSREGDSNIWRLGWDDDDDGGGDGGGGGDDDDDDDDPIPYYCTVYYWSLPGEPFNFPYSSWYRSSNSDYDVGWDCAGYVTIRNDIPVRIGYNFKGWRCSENGGTYWGG